MATTFAAALTRRSVVAPPRVSAARVARRCLGDTTAGRPIQDVAATSRSAGEFFTKHPQSYAEFKQQCVSLRLFAFAGVTSGCALALIINPPKSSYWMRWSPTYWYSNLFGSNPHVFLKEKAQHSVEVSSLVGLGAVECAAKAAVPKEALVGPGAGKGGAAVFRNVLRLPEKTAQPKVVFVLGGPGAGKGTQCGLVTEHFPEWCHISAGDCLRAERNDPSSKVGELINNYIKEGQIVPVEITVQLLQKAMASAEGKKCFLIDGFPRNLDNVTGWEKVVGNSAQVCGVLFFEAQEAQLEKRLLQRGETSGRADDNIESIKKRFRTYMTETMPIVENYRANDLVTCIDGMPAPDKVWKMTEAQIKLYEAM